MRNLLVLIGILALAFSFCGKKNEATTSNTDTERTVPVHVELVKEQQIVSTVLITGEVTARYKVTVFPRANGLVVKEFVKNGVRVKKDQILSEVKQDIPGMEYANVKINATADGIITRDAVNVGDRVTMQTPAYEISKIDPIDVQLDVPEKFLPLISKGELIPLTLDAFPGKSLQGKVREISPVVDPRSRMAMVKVSLKNSDQRLKPGMFARADLATETRTGLVVPLDAVIKSGVERYIFVIDENRARMVRIQTGEFLDSLVEIKGDVSANDTVVVMGQNLLSDGTLVTIIEEK